MRRRALRFLPLLVISFPALADEVRLTDGRVIGPGNTVAVGPTRLLFDGEGAGLQFIARADVAQLLDGAGRPRDWDQASAGELDPVAVVTGAKITGSGVRVRRRDEDVSLALHGAQAVLREGDLLRTGPYGRVTLELSSGGKLTARSDALVRFQEGRTLLLEGIVELEPGEGTTAAWIAEGRIDSIKGKAILERLRGRTRLTCVSGEAAFRAREGWKVELPRNHALDLKPETEQEPASLAASNANAWPLRFEASGRFVSIEPGERLLLLSLGAPRDQLADARPPVAPPSPVPAPAPTAPSPPPLRSAEPEAVAKVVRAGASFALERVGAEARQVDRAQAEGMALLSGDVIEGGEGELVIELAKARVRLLARSRLLLPTESGAPLRLVRGEATLETEDRATLAFGPGLGEVGLLRGATAVKVADQEATLALRTGTAGVRLGVDVRVPLLPGCELRAVRTGTRLQLSAPAGSGSLGPLLGSLEARLRPGQSLAYAKTGEHQVAELPTSVAGSAADAAGPARVELTGSVRAQVIPGPGEVDQLELEDGRRFPLAAGATLRFARRGDLIEQVGEAPVVAAAPPQPQPPPQEPKAAPPAPAAPPVAGMAPPAGSIRQVLANGAVVFLKDWGPLQVKRQVGTEVELEGPNGSLWLASSARAILSRLPGGRVRIDATDGRFVDWETGGLPFELKLAEDGGMLVTIDRGQLRRAIQVESSTEFDLLIRPDHARAFVFGQVKYVEPGQEVLVTRRSGLRTQMAADRR